jgi:hypothetical protein
MFFEAAMRPFAHKAVFIRLGIEQSVQSPDEFIVIYLATFFRLLCGMGHNAAILTTPSAPEQNTLKDGHAPS